MLLTKGRNPEAVLDCLNAKSPARLRFLIPIDGSNS
jgi:hypothetical protein